MINRKLPSHHITDLLRILSLKEENDMILNIVNCQSMLMIKIYLLSLKNNMEFIKEMCIKEKKKARGFVMTVSHTEERIYLCVCVW